MAVPVGVAWVDVRPDLTGFGQELRAGIARDLTGVAQSIRGTMSAAMTGLGSVFAASKFTGFISGAIDAASSLNESLSKSNTVFGEAAAAIDEWSRTAAVNIGLSRREALNAAGAFGNMFAQLGFGADETAVMSQRIVGLASDFASFHEADITDVIVAQSAAFRGEYDALQRFLPLMNAATIEQAALAETGKKNAKQLTAQEKALAAYNLMFSGAGDAAGDFARTSESLANQQRSLNSQWEDAKVELGEGLMPVMIEVTGFVKDSLIPAWKTFFSTEGDAVGWASVVRDAIADTMGFAVGILQQTLRTLANIVDVIPRIGDGPARDFRKAADDLDLLRDGLHASRAELNEWNGATGEAADGTAKLGDAAAGAASKVKTAGEIMTDALQKSIASMINPLQKLEDALGFSDVKQLLDSDKEWEASYRKLGAAAKAGLEPAGDAAKKTAISIGDVKRNLSRGITDVKEWLKDLQTLKDRGFGALATELANLGPDAAAAVDQATRLGRGPLSELEGLFAERTRLLGDPFIKGISDSLTGAAPQIATKTKTALHDALVAPPPVLKPAEAAAMLGPTTLPPLGPGDVSAEEYARRTRGWGYGPGGAPTGAPVAAAPAVGNVNVNVQTNADPYQIAQVTADTVSWRLGPKPTMVG